MKKNISYFKFWLTRFFPNQSLAFFVLAIVLIELLLHGFQENSYWNNEGLSVSVKGGLVALTFLLWSVIAWGVFWYVRLIQCMTANVNTKIGKNAIHLIAFFPLLICINLYVFSWYYFYRLGIFPTLDAFYFAIINASMLYKYFWQAEHYMLLVSTFCFLLISLLSIKLAKKYVKHISKTENNIIRPQVVILFFSINAFYFAIYLAESSSLNRFPHPSHERTAIVKNPWAPYGYELRYHVNPAITMFGSTLQVLEPKIEGTIPLEYLNPIIRFKPDSFPEIKPENKKNIILITIESLRSDSILKKHEEKLIMPHVANLAKEGHFFPECYSSSTHSDYSDPSILSSLYPLRTIKPHFYSKTDPWPKVLIYDVLKQYGYTTAIFSSQNEAWSNMHLFYESPNLDLLFDSRAYQASTGKEKGTYSAWQKDIDMAKWQKETGMIAGKLDDAITVRMAINWINARQNSQTPFFISMNLQTSHFPYQRPDRKQGPYQPSGIDPGVSLLYYEEEDIPILKNTYYNALSYIDSQIKHLTDELDRIEIRDETIIIITGDHGEAFLENGIASHGGKPLETVIKTGLIINNPILIEAMKDDYLVQAVDIAPTISGMLGIHPHPAFQGINVLSSQRPPNNSRFAFIHCCNALGSIDALISGTGWKFINDIRFESNELYFRPTDLTSQENLNSQENQVLEILKKYCQEWRGNQLLYYSKPKYYSWFYPPKDPTIESEKLNCLIKHAKKRGKLTCSP